MATITTNTFLDGGTARTAGEAMSFSNTTKAALTIRTDTRWHANAPASMTGTLGAFTGGLTAAAVMNFDGTKVRWMPFDTGTGNVPAIGTTITQGATTGYLLGVWATVDAAPTAVGAAMPTTGYLKFRDTTGSYTSGALSGIGANATSADVAGWIEIVFDVGSSHQMFYLGQITAKGAWFYLDNTTGARGQQIKTPINGGGAASHVYGVQIETAPASNVFEWYPCTTTAQGWTTANLTTDARAKFVETMGSGVVRIGSDGTSNIGYLPPAGCRVRIPNIICHDAATTARSVNVTPGSSSSTNRISIGAQVNIVDMANVSLSWQWSNSNSAYTKIEDSCMESGSFAIQNNAGLSAVNRSLFSTMTGIATDQFTITQSTGGVTMTDCVVNAIGTSATGFKISVGSENVVVTNLSVVTAKTRSNLTVYPANILNSNNITFNNLKMWGGPLTITTCSNVTINGYDYIDRLSGDTNATAGVHALRITTSSNVLVDGFTFGNYGQFLNANSYNAAFYTNQNIDNIKIRNAGTRAAPIDGGSGANIMQYIVDMGQNGTNQKFQRLYFTATRTGLANSLSASNKRLAFEHVFGTMSQTLVMAASDSTYVGLGATININAGQNGNVGVSWADTFTADAVGNIDFLANPPSDSNSSLTYFDPTSSSGATFSNTLQLFLPTVNDTFYSEMPRFVKGHTSFQNTLPIKTVSGAVASTNIEVFYQIDTGSGWNGTWKATTAANLSAEVIDPTIGFKLKIRCRALTAGTTSSNQVGVIRFFTNSSVAAQSTNLQPLDTVTVAFTGLVPGTEVRAYTGTNPATAVAIGGTEATAGTTFSFTHSNAGQAGYIAIFAMGYQPIYLQYTYPLTDTSLLIQQVIDRNYYNPA